MKWSRGVAGILMAVVAGVAVVYGMGRRLPAEHVATAAGVVGASQDKVWELITDTAQEANWRSGLLAVKPLPEQGGSPCWTEAGGGMLMPLCVMVEEPEVRRVVRVGDASLPFGGTWTWELAPVAGGTMVTITERATVERALWRFRGHYVMGDDTNVKQYLKDLQAEAVRRR
jgi:hypothetical protein